MFSLRNLSDLIDEPKELKETTTFTIKIPTSLYEKVDRHLDRLEVRYGIKANRASICRHALMQYFG